MSLITAGSSRSRAGFAAVPWPEAGVAIMVVNYTVQCIYVNW